jgi:integrase/recombinase XerD
MKRARRLYLPYSAWPEPDRRRWEAAFKAGTDRFDDCGPAAHLAERTRLQLQYAYGKFLFFILVRHDGLLAHAPAERLSRKIIEEYVKWQPRSCGGITTAIYLYHLWLALRYICPSEEWSWLLTVSKRIRASTKQKPKKHHLVTSETLYALGLRLMDRAIANATAAKDVTTARALDYRNGLIIALLALCPLRRRTVAALRIGKHLVQSGALWALDIPAADTKTRRPLEYPISAELSRRIDVYLSQFRPRIRGAVTHDYLWACSRARPMNDRGIYAAVRECTREALGFPVNLHRFRHAAATFWSIRDPANVRGAKDLLGHASFAPTEKDYIMGQSRLAGRALARAIGNMETKSAIS